MDLSHAIELYQRAIEYADFPRITAQAESNLGNLLQRRAGKDLQGLAIAAEHLEKAVQADPTFMDARFNLATLLQDLNFLEVSSQESQDSKAVSLRTQPLDQVSETHFATVIKVSLSHDIFSQAVSSTNVLEDELVELLALKLLDCARQVDLLLNFISKAELLRILLLLLII